MTTPDACFIYQLNEYNEHYIGLLLTGCVPILINTMSTQVVSVQ